MTLMHFPSPFLPQEIIFSHTHTFTPCTEDTVCDQAAKHKTTCCAAFNAPESSRPLIMNTHAGSGKKKEGENFISKRQANVRK
jgi:hypothetical protein